ncbi:MAG: YbaB/EbfC family nucleoid-associated protein [Planctomycetota bacterium]
MFQGISNFASLLKNFTHISGRVQQLQEELRKRRAVGSAGGGMVEFELNGLLEVLRCTIDPQLVAQGDQEMIEDLVVAAANEAIGKGRQLHAEALRNLTGGIDLPGLTGAIDQFAAGPPQSDENEETGDDPGPGRQP